MCVHSPVFSSCQVDFLLSSAKSYELNLICCSQLPDICIQNLSTLQVFNIVSSVTRPASVTRAGGRGGTITTAGKQRAPSSPIILPVIVHLLSTPIVKLTTRIQGIFATSTIG